MNILTLSPIIIIIIAIVFFLITKKIFKALGFLLLISLIVFFISSILIYRDVQEFQNNFPNEEKLFLLEQNGNYAAGFIMSDLKNSQDVVLLGNQNINEIRPLTKHQILGDNYKLLIFKESAFNEVDNINFANKPLSK
ncbi:MAG: hypothetical protein KAQ83_04210, partial [Nanoarchaeota archaeon]|nr:hypothetical protein [Nanoarchaeota archaeon]